MTYDLSALRGLEKRLSEASRPNFVLEHDIFELLDHEFLAANGARVPNFTASLDAAVGLVARVLPGWGWRCGFGLSPHWVNGVAVYGWSHLNRVHPDHALSRDEATGYAATAPLALCLAIVRALIAQGEK